METLVRLKPAKWPLEVLCRSERQAEVEASPELILVAGLHESKKLMEFADEAVKLSARGPAQRSVNGRAG